MRPLIVCMATVLFVVLLLAPCMPTTLDARADVPERPRLTLTEFTDGRSTDTHTFVPPRTKATTWLEMSNRAFVHGANVTITFSPPRFEGEGFREPVLDVGGDGIVEWHHGPGPFLPIGEQTMLEVEYKLWWAAMGEGERQETYTLLPRWARVSLVEMQVMVEHATGAPVTAVFTVGGEGGAEWVWDDEPEEYVNITFDTGPINASLREISRTAEESWVQVPISVQVDKECQVLIKNILFLYDYAVRVDITDAVKERVG